MVNTYTEIQ